MSGSTQLGAVLICPNGKLRQQFHQAVVRREIFELLEEMQNLPSVKQLDARLRQLRPDVLLLDLTEDLDAALALATSASNLRPPIPVVGLHTEKDASVIIQLLRAGGTEFLSPPFDSDSVSAVTSRIRKMQEVRVADGPVRGQVYAFVAVKAGQGVTTIAANVAAAIASRTGKRPLLIDFDTVASTVSFSWRITHSYSVVDAMQNSERLDEAMWAALTASRNEVDVLLGPDVPEWLTLQSTESFTQLVEQARLRYTAVILDLPSVYGPAARATLPSCDHIHMISNAELPSLHLTRRAISHLEREGFSRNQFSLIINRLSRRGELGAQDIERVFNFPLAQVFPEDDGAVHRALTAGKPIPETVELGRALGKFAQSLSGEEDDKKKDRKKSTAGLKLSALLSNG